MKNLKQKGFTLVEILIVVVILAILASLVIPRLLSQPERANIAEAQQTLGMMRRAQTQVQDLGGAFVSCANCTNAQLAPLSIELRGTPKYDYSCVAGVGATDPDGIPGNGDETPAVGSTCEASRTAAGGILAGATVTLDIDNGTFTCSGGYTDVAAAPNDRGCQI